jgi:malate synthase
MAAEIARSQIWQWVHHAVTLDDGTAVTPALVQAILIEQTNAIREELGEPGWSSSRFKQAGVLLADIALARSSSTS